MKIELKDHVVISASGAATHTLTIAYNFPIKKHIYTSSLVSYYAGFIEVIAPKRATLQSMRGCVARLAGLVQRQAGHERLGDVATRWQADRHVQRIVRS